jgi:hypothetical protein
MRSAVIVMSFVALGFGIYMAFMPVDPDTKGLNMENSNADVRFSKTVSLKDLPPAYVQRLDSDERQIIETGLSALNSIFNQLGEPVAPYLLKSYKAELKRTVTALPTRIMGDGGSPKEYQSHQRVASIKQGSSSFDFWEGTMEMVSGPIIVPALVVSGPKQAALLLISPGIESKRWHAGRGSCAYPCLTFTGPAHNWTIKAARKTIDSTLGQCVIGQAKLCPGFEDAVVDPAELRERRVFTRFHPEEFYGDASFNPACDSQKSFPQMIRIPNSKNAWQIVHSCKKQVPAGGDFRCIQGLLNCLANYWLELEKQGGSTCRCVQSKCGSYSEEAKLYCD